MPSVAITSTPCWQEISCGGLHPAISDAQFGEINLEVSCELDLLDNVLLYHLCVIVSEVVYIERDIRMYVYIDMYNVRVYIYIYICAHSCTHMHTDMQTYMHTEIQYDSSMNSVRMPRKAIQKSSTTRQ